MSFQSFLCVKLGFVFGELVYWSMKIMQATLTNHSKGFIISAKHNKSYSWRAWRPFMFSST